MRQRQKHEQRLKEERRIRGSRRGRAAGGAGADGSGNAICDGVLQQEQSQPGTTVLSLKVQE